MWTIAVVFVVVHLVGWVLGEADDITVSCSTCTRHNNKILGIVGGKAVLEYTINNQNFIYLTIYFNSTKNFFDVAPDLVNRDHITDPRLTIEKSERHGLVVVRIELKDLTLGDDGVVFRYVYKDRTLNEFQGLHILNVHVKQSKRNLDAGDSKYNIIIIVCVAVVVVVVAILILCLDES